MDCSYYIQMPKWLWNSLSWFYVKLAFTLLIHFVWWKQRRVLQARSVFCWKRASWQWAIFFCFFGPQFPYVSNARVGQTSDLNPVKNKSHVGSLLESSLRGLHPTDADLPCVVVCLPLGVCPVPAAPLKAGPIFLVCLAVYPPLPLSTQGKGPRNPLWFSPAITTLYP